MAEGGLDLRKKGFEEKNRDDERDVAIKNSQFEQKHALATEKFSNDKDEFVTNKIQEMGHRSQKLAPVVNGLRQVEGLLPPGGYTKLAQDLSQGLTGRISSEDDAKYRQAWNQVVASYRNGLYGAALTDNEIKEANKLFGAGASYDPQALARGVDLIRGATHRQLAQYQSRLARKFGEDFEEYRYDTNDTTFMNSVFADLNGEQAGTGPESAREVSPDSVPDAVRELLQNGAPEVRVPPMPSRAPAPAAPPALGPGESLKVHPKTKKVYVVKDGQVVREAK